MKPLRTGRRIYLCFVTVSTVVASTAIKDAAAGDHIYRCEAQGRVTYSDTGCVNAADKVEVAVKPLNTFQEEPIPAGQHSGQSKPQKSGHSQHARTESIASELQRSKLLCQRLADRLETVQVKQRTGHTAEQGERLREQQRQLEQQRRTEKCH
jgi:hypothetical protein